MKYHEITSNNGGVVGVNKEVQILCNCVKYEVPMT